jgi:hypothetical protein
MPATRTAPRSLPREFLIYPVSSVAGGAPGVCNRVGVGGGSRFTSWGAPRGMFRRAWHDRGLWDVTASPWGRRRLVPKPQTTGARLVGNPRACFPIRARPGGSRFDDYRVTVATESPPRRHARNVRKIPGVGGAVGWCARPSRPICCSGQASWPGACAEDSWAGWRGRVVRSPQPANLLLRPGKLAGGMTLDTRNHQSPLSPTNLRSVPGRGAGGEGAGFRFDARARPRLARNA